MMQHFFITGLPRSRTVWLANLMTYGPSFCLHEGCRFGTLAGLISEMGKVQTGMQYVGNSDSGLLVWAEELTRRFPSARWVLVKRRRKDAEKSFLEYFRKNTYQGMPKAQWAPTRTAFRVLEKLCSDLPRVIKPENLIEIDFDYLESEWPCRRIWQHCIPDVAFNSERWQMLNTFRMTIMAEKVTIPENYVENLRASL